MLVVPCSEKNCQVIQFVTFIYIPDRWRSPFQPFKRVTFLPSQKGHELNHLAISSFSNGDVCSRDPKVDTKRIPTKQKPETYLAKCGQCPSKRNMRNFILSPTFLGSFRKFYPSSKNLSTLFVWFRCSNFLQFRAWRWRLLFWMGEQFSFCFWFLHVPFLRYPLKAVWCRMVSNWILVKVITWSLWLLPTFIGLIPCLLLTTKREFCSLAMPLGCTTVQNIPKMWKVWALRGKDETGNWRWWSEILAFGDFFCGWGWISWFDRNPYQ